MLTGGKDNNNLSESQGNLASLDCLGRIHGKLFFVCLSFLRISEKLNDKSREAKHNLRRF